MAMIQGLIQSRKRIVDQKNVGVQIRDYLSNLDYDFSNFSMTDFMQWAAEKLDSQIKLLFAPLHQSDDGLVIYIKDINMYFIIINEALPEWMRLHTQAHELGHIVFPHPIGEIGSEELQQFLLNAKKQPAISLIPDLMMRQGNDEFEIEAEIFARELMEKHRVSDQYNRFFKKNGSRYFDRLGL